jgi:predicted nucleic acid-binding protein
VRILLDTNFLTRSAEPGSPQYGAAIQTLDRLMAEGHELCVVPQNLYEFWVVATRPAAQNGLGLSIAQAEGEVQRLLRSFLLLDDPPGLVNEWRRLVNTHACVGKVAHDARLVAAMVLHRIVDLLTFNAGDFHRFSGLSVQVPVRVNPPTP